MRPREETAASAAAGIRRAIADPYLLAARPALVGFDGFVDSIIHVVDTRLAMEESAFSRLATIEQFAARVGSAAGKSTNIELVVKEDRFGGNGPLMAGALGRLGVATTYIGAVGREDDPTQLHPLYRELERRCRMVIPVAPPAHTDALEFVDGKVMLGKTRNIQSVTWASLKGALGLPRLTAMVGECTLVAVVNWVMMGGVESIWEGLATEVLPTLPSSARPRLFFDLCDPAKRSNEDLIRALRRIQTLQRETAVTLGLNLSEAERVAAVLGLECFEQPGLTTRSGVLCGAAGDVPRSSCRPWGGSCFRKSWHEPVMSTETSS